MGVTLGGVCGHALCTGAAVAGGRAFASSISERTVALAGGLLFLAFGAHTLFEHYGVLVGVAGAGAPASA